jgi:hypothetical protein
MSVAWIPLSLNLSMSVAWIPLSLNLSMSHASLLHSTIVCKDLEVAAKYAGEGELDCLTMEGDKVSGMVLLLSGMVLLLSVGWFCCCRVFCVLVSCCLLRFALVFLSLACSAVLTGRVANTQTHSLTVLGQPA